jgi:hypothetical protein
MGQPNHEENEGKKSSNVPEEEGLVGAFGVEQ